VNHVVDTIAFANLLIVDHHPNPRSYTAGSTRIRCLAVDS
jgi:hypothetical protein